MTEPDEPHPDEVAAAAAAETEDTAARARAWLIASSAATLGTTSCQRGIEGFPFGSVVPFALTGDGRPIVLLAEMAAHTANLRRDARASLFVRQADVEGDPQAGWRVTLLGRMQRIVLQGQEARADDLPVTRAEHDEIEARYLERVPSAEKYHLTHDFHFWHMASIVKGRYIAGFGRICWLDGAKLQRDPDGAGLGEAAAGAIAHMNEDHASSLLEMCGARGVSPEQAEMIGVDRTGLLVRTSGPERVLHFSFGREIAAADLRLAVIDVLRRARARVGAKAPA